MAARGDGTPEGVWQDEQCEGCPGPNDGRWRAEYSAWICDEHYAECARREWAEYDE